MTHRNYKAECIAILAHIKSQKEFNANTWTFDAYQPGKTTYVKIISIGATDADDFELFGDTRRTWKELADFLRAYSRGFWHGVKTGLEAEQTRRICIEVKTTPNRSGNRKRLYLLFTLDGYRQEVTEDISMTQHCADSITISTAEFREYARIANVQKGTK